MEPKGWERFFRVLENLTIALVAVVAGVIYAAYYNRTHHIAEWGTLAANLRIPVPLWLASLILVGLGVFGLLYRRVRKAQALERSNLEDLKTEANVLKSQIEHIRLEHAAEIQALRKLPNNQGEVKAPIVHTAWDGKTRWRWSYLVSQRVLRITGTATMLLDNTRESPLITGVRIEGAQFFGEFSSFRLIPGQEVYKTFHLDFTGMTAGAGIPLTVKFLFVNIKGELFPTNEMTFQPVDLAPVGADEVWTPKKSNPIPPR